jgi:hypothetical protein
MRRFALLFLPVCFAVAFAAGGRHISARAGFSIPHEAQIGSASVVMDISGTKGTFQYAAEDHDDLLCSTEPIAMRYPHVIIKSTKILSTNFKGRSFTMVAEADFQGEPVKIEVFATDGGPRQADSFEIKCFDANGGLIYMRGNKIEVGDISIK